MENSGNKIMIASIIISAINVVVIVSLIIYLFTGNGSGQYKELYKNLEAKDNAAKKEYVVLNEKYLQQKKENIKWILLVDSLKNGIIDLDKNETNIKKYYEEKYFDIDNYSEFQLDSLITDIKNNSTGL